MTIVTGFLPTMIIPHQENHIRPISGGEFGYGGEKERDEE